MKPPYGAVSVAMSAYRKMRDRVRLGKYIKAALTTGDFIVLNVSYFIILWILLPDHTLCSKTVWLLANLSFIPSSLIYNGVHNDRIIYADRLVLNALKSSLVFAGVMLALLYVFDIFDVGSRAMVLMFLTFFFMLSVWWISSRWLLKKIRRMGFNFKRVVIIGAGATGKMVAGELASDAGYGYRLMGVFDNDSRLLESFHRQFTGSLSEVENFVRLNKIDILYYTFDAEDEDAIRTMMNVAEEIGAQFVYVPKFHKVLAGQFQISSLGTLPSMEHSLSPLHKTRNKILKRVFDIVVSGVFLIFSPVIFIPIAVGIKLTSKGPILFRQKRTGIYGTEFVCYKFRTMRVNPMSDVLQATADDPRKTKFGDFLRRSSLDELPQFYNVLKGNMSVVGPRPHMISHTEEYSALIDKYMVRHAVKPGITGWAQVNGYRGATKQLWQMEKRVDYDVWYIRNWNLFLDLKIIFLTVFNGLRGDKNAY